MVPADGAGTTTGGSETDGSTATPGAGQASSDTMVPEASDSADSSSGEGSSDAACTIEILNSSLSEEIPTVGIVEWATELPGITGASIEFGLDTNYGLTAPVDLAQQSYRTLLLGMKAGGHTYHFRVVAETGEQKCTSDDQTLPPTGEPPNILPQLTLTPPTADGLAGGFLVMETFKQAFGASGDGAAYIIDADGDFVWWHVVPGFVDLSRAKQSYDSQYMWIGTVNVMSNTQKMLRVKMDGSEVEDLTQQFGNTHHDFAVHPDGTVAYLAYGTTCDDIKERAPDGTTTTLVDSTSVLGASACHCNAIQYDRNDDTIVFSELETSSIAKIARGTGEVQWVFSSENVSKATITGVSWTNEHNFHIIDPEHLLFFNNGTGPNSTAIEVQLSLGDGGGTANQIWSYPSDITVQYMGDVQRLDNGNTLVTYSSAGEVREVNAGGELLQSIRVGSGTLIGFTEKRTSLYGPPPR
jgi:hypothetical protein